ncbi:thioredoxin domain-containing protein [Natronosporangium hydrolyticum]|uniref:Thioredoxin domain-containing protein n=1 Tax=Natronosporangium hydrolyticum TaxID=2811111 RepID=A0A895Y9G7_9ACTN|nr:thioredoxin domain-containing protein [Natronosporangium hydrolyticum]QSB14404.1 thioredoxin domain-containing protein [Natronosporangium hydrolyticum]
MTKRTARQRRAQRAAQTPQSARWVSIVAVAGLLAAGLVGIGIWQAGRPGDVAVPAAATEDEAGLPVGDGPVVVEVYLDFLCPACQQFDQASRPVLDEYLADDVVTLVYRPIAILDDRTSTRYSTRAAAAAGCAADSGILDEFVDELLAVAPQPGSVGLTDADISGVGAQAGAMDATFDQCVRDGDYRDWVGFATEAAADQGVHGTPTVLVDGARLESLSVPALVEAVDAAALRQLGN